MAIFFFLNQQNIFQVIKDIIFWQTFFLVQKLFLAAKFARIVSLFLLFACSVFDKLKIHNWIGSLYTICGVKSTSPKIECLPSYIMFHFIHENQPIRSRVDKAQPMNEIICRFARACSESVYACVCIFYRSNRWLSGTIYCNGPCNSGMNRMEESGYRIFPAILRLS
jgi:hypothetical protein